jgi:signal transduction histidine kinase
VRDLCLQLCGERSYNARHHSDTLLVGDGMSRGVATSGPRRPALAKLPVSRPKARSGAVIPDRVVKALAEMGNSKVPARHGPQKVTATAPRQPTLPAEHGVAVVQEKVLAEIAHELGNFFHKLYYWSDYLKEKPARKTSDSTAAQMLERTIKNLEDFLKISFDYVHPTQLSFTRMAVGDLVEGLLHQVRAQLNGSAVTIPDTDVWRGAELEVLVDPGHLSYAFEVAVRQLAKQVGPESTITIDIVRSARRDVAGLEVGFRLRQPNEASPLFRTAEAGIEWAVAQKFVALHGGELAERSEVPGEKDMILFLPLCP